MEVASTTTTASLSAIHESLMQISMTLSRMAARQDQMLVDSKKMTAALVSTTPVTGQVLEQHTTKPSSSSLFSPVQVMGSGATYDDTLVASATPTRCSTVGSAVSVGSNHVAVAFPTSGTTHLPTTTSTGAMSVGAVHPSAGLTCATPARCSPPVADLLTVCTGFPTTTLASCSAYVLTNPPEGSTAGAHVVNTNPPRITSFPCFDGTNPRLWRTQCLEYFNRFNINKGMWVTAARMHMDGKAKEWFEAYKLRKVVGAWPEFIGDVEAHFAVGDLTSTIILGVAAHPSKVVHAGGDISLETPTRCSPVSAKEMMATTAERTEPTLVQLAESIKLQFTQSKLALTSEFVERKKKIHLRTVTQMAVAIADSSEEVLTHVGGVSLFLEPLVAPAEMVFSKTSLIELVDEVFTCVGGSTIFMELDIDSANMVFEDDVVTTVGGVALFLEQNMDNQYELEGEIDKNTCLDHGVGGFRVVPLVVPVAEGKLQRLLSREMLHGSDRATVFFPWDPSASIIFVPETTCLSGEVHPAHAVTCVFIPGKEGREIGHCMLAELLPWNRNGFSPGKHEHLHMNFQANTTDVDASLIKQLNPGIQLILWWLLCHVFKDFFPALVLDLEPYMSIQQHLELVLQRTTYPKWHLAHDKVLALLYLAEAKDKTLCQGFELQYISIQQLNTSSMMLLWSQPCYSICNQNFSTAAWLTDDLFSCFYDGQLVQVSLVRIGIQLVNVGSHSSLEFNNLAEMIQSENHVLHPSLCQREHYGDQDWSLVSNSRYSGVSTRCPFQSHDYCRVQKNNQVDIVICIACLHIPWDPGGTVGNDIPSIAWDKQCFVRAVMSYLHVMTYWAEGSWAVGQVKMGCWQRLSSTKQSGSRSEQGSNRTE